MTRAPSRVTLVISGVAVLLAATVLTPVTSAAATAPLAPSAAVRSLPRWQPSFAGQGESFGHVDAVSRSVAWLGSDGGTVLRTSDGGGSWADVSPPGAADLRFRSVVAADPDHAVAMSAGPGTTSRLYMTADAGKHWRLSYQATDPDTFFDGMAFYDAQHGLVVGDPVDGRFQVVATSDGGRTWAPIPAVMPAVRAGEYGLADSGTMVAVAGHDAWFGTSGSAARIFHSSDGGHTWDVASTSILNSAFGGAAGIFSVAFRTRDLGVAVGGDLLTPAFASHVSARSVGGAPWRRPAREPNGERSAVTWLPGTRPIAIAVGTTGSDISYDAGQHWTRFGYQSLRSVDCTSDGSCWGAGDYGVVTVLDAVPGAGAQKVASGLDGALGSTVGPDGALYVPEANTGTIARIDPITGHRTIWATGLPRRVFVIGGAIDVAFLNGKAYVLVTLVSPDVGGTAADGVYRIDGPGRVSLIADIGAWSLAHPPKPAFFIPTGVQFALLPYGGNLLVTDGHHNRVLEVRLNGTITQVQTFDDVVPTGLARVGRSIFFTEAGPVPHLPQNGRVFRIGSPSATPRLVAKGASLLVDVEPGAGGLYALSQGVFTPGHDEGSPADPGTGALVRVEPDGTMMPVAVGLDRPTSLEIIGHDAYVVTLPGAIWRIALG
jgi:photosystem II stability/assembly factor-like uncharacterized protein